jgi:putative ABC transport system permease protein
VVLRPAGSDFQATAETLGLTVVVVGLATLEIVLLAGTAFAVGARRKRRELGLVAATGGDRGDVRRIVLAGGVVLGAFAGLLGIAGGIAAVAWGAPVLNRLSGSMQGPLDIRPLELGAIVAIGAGTALLACVLPARTAARLPVVAALTGRRGQVRTRKRVPVIALGAVAVGAALAFWAAGDGRVPAAYVDNVPVQAGRPANFNLLLAGAVLAELGFVACAPALVGLVGRLASRLPLSLRLAARDAARHRTRSGPAVAAVVAAVAGSVAVSVYMSSDTERQRRMYEESLPRGSVRIVAYDPANPVGETDVAAAAAALPVRDRIEVADVAAPCTTVGRCASWMPEVPVAFRCDAAPDDVTCAGKDGPIPGRVTVAGPEYAGWLGSGDGAGDSLRAGSAVVFDARWLQGGRLVVRNEVYDPAGTRLSSRRIAVPAVVAAAPAFTDRPVAVLTPETARRYGLPAMASATLLTTTRMPSRGEEAAARGALTSKVEYADLYVERGFRPRNPFALLALVGAAAFATIASTGIATGLAAADSRPDLATLAAVGAAPRVRRRLAMAQAATVAALGSALGILAGLVPSVAVVAARAEFPLAMPWGALGVIAVGVPSVAALLVGAVTRSRLPLERRLA